MKISLSSIDAHKVKEVAKYLNESKEAFEMAVRASKEVGSPSSWEKTFVGHAEALKSYALHETKGNPVSTRSKIQIPFN